MMIWLLVGMAFALEPPSRPEPPAPISGECPESFSVTPDSRDNPDCTAVALPLSVAADLYATEKWAEHLAARYRLDTAELELSVQMADWKSGQLQQMLESERNQPILQRPGVHVAIGLVGGVVVTVGAGWALQQVAND
jgi:hypothetical protein